MDPTCAYGGGQYGDPEPPYGECLDQVSPTPPSPEPPVQEEVQEETGAYLVSFDFPLRFLPKGDIVLVTNDRAIRNSLMLTVFVRHNGIPLVPLGVGVEDDIFDLNDETIQDWLYFRIRDGIALGVDGVVPLEEMQFSTDEHTLRVAIPYFNTKTRQQSLELVNVPPMVKVDRK